MQFWVINSVWCDLIRLLKSLPYKFWSTEISLYDSNDRLHYPTSLHFIQRSIDYEWVYFHITSAYARGAQVVKSHESWDLVLYLTQRMLTDRCTIVCLWRRSRHPPVISSQEWNWTEQLARIIEAILLENTNDCAVTDTKRCKITSHRIPSYSFSFLRQLTLVPNVLKHSLNPVTIKKVNKDGETTRKYLHIFRDEIVGY